MLPSVDPADAFSLAVSDILRDVWDPLHVSGIEPSEEYDAYVPYVVALLRAGAGREIVVAYLQAVATFDMDLVSAVPSQHEPAADALLMLGAGSWN